MKKISPSLACRSNMLRDIHKRMNQLPITFRARVCEECNWSVPTFYRKMRCVDKVDPETSKVTPVLSNAERDKIMAVMEEVYMDRM